MSIKHTVFAAEAVCCLCHTSTQNSRAVMLLQVSVNQETQIASHRDLPATLVLVFRKKKVQPASLIWASAAASEYPHHCFLFGWRKNNHISALLIFQLIYELSSIPSFLFLATFLSQLHFYRAYLVYYGSWFLLNYFWDRKWWCALTREDKPRRRKGGKRLSRSHLFKLLLKTVIFTESPQKENIVYDRRRHWGCEAILLLLKKKCL